MGASGSKKELTAESHPHRLLQDFYDECISRKASAPAFCCPFSCCGSPALVEKAPLDNFKTFLFALSNAPGCATCKGREAAHLVTEDNISHLAFMVVERAATAERDEDRSTLATFIAAIDTLQPVPFATLKSSRVVMAAIDHLSAYATSSPTAEDLAYRKAMANLGDLLGKLLALVDHHAAAPFTSRLPGMLERACRDGHLLTLLPVVCGILRQLSASGVEGDGDVQTALSMLKDIGDLPNIRLQLQFNVVRLFKELQLDIDSLQTTGRVSTTAMAASEVQEQS